MLKIAGNKMKKYKLSLINKKKKKKNSEQVLITIHVCLLRACPNIGLSSFPQILFT